MEGEEPSMKEGRGLRRSCSFSGVVDPVPGISKTSFRVCCEYGEENESYGTEAVPAPVAESEGAEGPALANSNNTVSHKSYTPLLKFMYPITQIMANILEVSYFEASRQPTFKEQELFDGTQPLKVRSFIQYSQLIVYDDKEHFSEDKKKVLYANSFLIG
ncbi:hypothetical protein O181_103477 [Austropuccinia psidii MF-1]|uniref:Uncharacterized protein n=1 Tax=Austropuccinia psidii MF-1 TaxID=1389203 RepID=A0A9Q3JL88_9BASI|nr:hypothetical protein [Austropuccinia psidii MF-1]